jgi:hypothetical protein
LTRWHRIPRQLLDDTTVRELEDHQCKRMAADLPLFMRQRYPTLRNVVAARVLLTLGAQAAVKAGVDIAEIVEFAVEEGFKDELVG